MLDVLNWIDGHGKTAVFICLGLYFLISEARRK